MNDNEVMIPVNIMCITGNNDTPVENRISYSQIVFIKPSQWELFALRLNDLVTTLNGIADDNRKEEPDNAGQGNGTEADS
jgi:hypothetical protein